MKTFRNLTSGNLVTASNEASIHLMEASPYYEDVASGLANVSDNASKADATDGKPAKKRGRKSESVE